MKLKKFNELFDSEKVKTEFGSYDNKRSIEIADLEADEPVSFSSWLTYEFPFFVDPVYKDKAQIYTFMGNDTYTTIIFYILSKSDIEMFVNTKQLDSGDINKYNKKFTNRDELKVFINSTLTKELSKSGVRKLQNINPSRN